MNTPSDHGSRVSVVGLIGGVASGKSSVARRFEELGATIIDGDRLGHEVLADPDVKELLKQRWGDEVISSTGDVDRRAVASRVFRNGEDLKFLEKVTHPRIGQLIQSSIARVSESIRFTVPGSSLTDSPSKSVVILDAAIMLKAGWDAYCDKVLFVDAPIEKRKDRALQRGWTLEHFELREASQLSTEEKRRRSDIVIDNGGCLDQTYEQVLKAWNSLSL